jgi:sugar phosphate isomerase/epimerase
LEEIPFDSDFPALLEEFASPTVVYWHDFGHAQIKENLGIISHQMHLRSLQQRLGGVHIHDVEFPGRDHRPPGSGTVDFAALRPLVSPEAIKVFEFSPRLSAGEVRGGVEHVRSLWEANPPRD